jgi:membrane fusion protein
MSLPLFRKEVLAQRQTQWLGTVLLVPRLSHALFGGFAVLTTVAMLALLWFGHYTRKAHIGGWLVPERGLVQVFAPQAGVVTQLNAQEGREVQAGDPLLVLSAELQSRTLGATHMEIARRLGERRRSLWEERSRRMLLQAQQARSLRARLEALDSEVAQLDSDIALQRSRMALAVQSEAREQELRQLDLISEEQLQAAQERRLDQDAKLGVLERSRIAADRDRLTLTGELEELPLKSQAEIANIERDIGTLDQELAEAEARREIVVPAPAAGTVTAIQAELGGRPNPSVPLLSIVPAGSKLEAHLFSPSRAIGFLRPGQRVLLRFQAYPFQKFGHYEGVLVGISGSAVNPSELPAQLVGLTSLVGTSEPVYRITVSLTSQTVTVYGQPVPLQPGMQLDADVLIERRRLIEWVLDPLYTLTGKWNG